MFSRKLEYWESELSYITDMSVKKRQWLILKFDAPLGDLVSIQGKADGRTLGNLDVMLWSLRHDTSRAADGGGPTLRYIHYRSEHERYGEGHDTKIQTELWRPPFRG